MRFLSGLLWLADKKLAIQARTMLVDALNRINKHSNAISSLGLRPADNKLVIIFLFFLLKKIAFKKILVSKSFLAK